MDHCQRCKKKTSVLTGSWFNTQMICMDCSDNEEKRGDINKAKEADRTACRQGNFNFKGIGIGGEE